MDHPTIVLAGATGNLGARIARELRTRGADVRALVRASADRERVGELRARGVEIAEVDFDRSTSLARACEGASIVVSALSGLREVIVDAQSALLGAAIDAGVPRFVPSDFALDFTRTRPGRNRNLDLRRELGRRLDRAPIAATSILCGMYADLLTGQAPFVLWPIRRVLVWGSADQPMDFTAIDDVAAYTAEVALDASTPRYLRIAGDVRTARELAEDASEVTGRRHRLLHAGPTGRLDRLVTVARALAPARDEVYPAWQGMQYMRDMFEGDGKLAPLDGDRYPGIRWTRVRDVLRARGGGEHAPHAGGHTAAA